MIFNSKIFLACDNSELRPALSCVHFTKGFAWATDAHILIKQCLKKCFDCTPEDIAMLEGMSIEPGAYKLLLGRPMKVSSMTGKRKSIDHTGPIEVEYTRVFLTTIYGNSKLTIELKSAYDIGKFPDGDKVITKNFENVCPSHEVWYDPKLFKRAIDCMYHEAVVPRICIWTTKKNTASYIMSSDMSQTEQVVLIMPVMEPTELMPSH